MHAHRTRNGAIEKVKREGKIRYMFQSRPSMHECDHFKFPKHDATLPQVNLDNLEWIPKAPSVLCRQSTAGQAGQDELLA